MGIEDGAVEFDYDTRPTKLGHFSVLYPPYYRSQVKKEKSMRGIPVAHARWIGSLLSQLSDDQLRDAFGPHSTTTQRWKVMLRHCGRESIS